MCETEKKEPETCCKPYKCCLNCCKCESNGCCKCCKCCSRNEITNTEKELLHEHAWNHFKFTAQQRIDLFKHYVIFISIFAAIFYHISTPNIGIAIALGVLIITIFFNLVEIRNKHLVDTDKKALEQFEKDFMKDRPEEYRIFTQDKCPIITHSRCYQILFYIVYGLSIMAIAWQMALLTYGSNFINIIILG